MSKYSISFQTVAEKGEQEKTLVAALGSLKLVTTASKEGLAAIKGQPGEFVATVIELDGEQREVVRVKATEDIVTLVVRKRLADERKQAGEGQAEIGAPAAGTEGDADTAHAA